MMYVFKHQQRTWLKVNLRDYQKEVIKNVENYFKNNNRQYIEMPTGSGKTITFLSYAYKNHKEILVVVPSRELLNQVYESALLFYHKSEISRKGNNFNELPKKLHICVINSIKKDYLEFIKNHNFDLVVIDEAHHSQSETYKRLINNMSSTTKFLGVTATPERLDGLLLGDILHFCSSKLETMDLIEKGFLSDIEGFSVKTRIDISDVDSHNGDFNINQLYNKLCTESRNQMIIDLCQKEMLNRKVLIFCVNIKHSKEISRMLNDNGISSKHIDGKSSSLLRKSIISAFKSGEIQALTNCQLLTEGFDEPSIDGIILARPTKSRSLYNQMIGRGLRLCQGKKNCKIIDIVDNHKSLIGFNQIIEESKSEKITSFKSIKDIQKHIQKEKWRIAEYEIERANLLIKNKYDELEPTDSMLNYLKENNILHYSPSFNEANFMIWFNEKRKEFLNGNNSK